MSERVVAKPVRIQAADARTKLSNRETWAMVCYYYPQYDLQTASQLSVRDIKLLLKIAEQLEAKKYYNLTQIAAAPHTKKGKGVKDLTDHFQKMMR